MPSGSAAPRTPPISQISSRLADYVAASRSAPGPGAKSGWVPTRRSFSGAAKFPGIGTIETEWTLSMSMGPRRSIPTKAPTLSGGSAARGWRRPGQLGPPLSDAAPGRHCSRSWRRCSVIRWRYCPRLGSFGSTISRAPHDISLRTGQPVTADGCGGTGDPEGPTQVRRGPERRGCGASALEWWNPASRRGLVEGGGGSARWCDRGGAGAGLSRLAPPRSSGPRAGRNRVPRVQVSRSFGGGCPDRGGAGLDGGEDRAAADVRRPGVGLRRPRGSGCDRSGAHPLAAGGGGAVARRQRDQGDPAERAAWPSPPRLPAVGGHGSVGAASTVVTHGALLDTRIADLGIPRDLIPFARLAVRRDLFRLPAVEGVRWIGAGEYLDILRNHEAAA